MGLTTAQLATLKAHIDASGDLNVFPNNGDTAVAIAAILNLTAAPDYFVWRTNVTRQEIYNTTSLDATSWSWSFYKSQSVTEQNAWTQMFMGDQADFSKVNLRSGIGNIFTAGSSVNRDHALATGRRKATRAEKLFATAVVNPPANTGNSGGAVGSGTNPAVMNFEGNVTPAEVEQARSN